MKRLFSPSRAAVIVLLFGVLWAAWWAFEPDHGGRPGFSPEPEGSVSRREVRRLYRRHCSSCHGRDGRGRGPAAALLDPPPRNFRGDTLARRTDRELFEVITEGRPERGMPGWKGVLSEGERWALVRYLRRAFGREEEASES